MNDSIIEATLREFEAFPLEFCYQVKPARDMGPREAALPIVQY